MLLNGKKTAALVEYMKANNIKFRKGSTTDTLFDIKVGTEWFELKKDIENRQRLLVPFNLQKMISSFMTSRFAKNFNVIFDKRKGGCTFDTRSLEGHTFMNCPSCGLRIIPGLPHPRTRTNKNGKVVYL